jgi:hypothetical protein
VLVALACVAPLAASYLPPRLLKAPGKRGSRQLQLHVQPRVTSARDRGNSGALSLMLTEKRVALH